MGQPQYAVIYVMILILCYVYSMLEITVMPGIHRNTNSEAGFQ